MESASKKAVLFSEKAAAIRSVLWGEPVRRDMISCSTGLGIFLYYFFQDS
jgi:hypothetical protein